MPILALAQLTREAATKEKPGITDVAGAYQIARDSDTVALLSISSEEMKKRKECKPYAVTYEVVKERNGKVGEERVMFQPTQTRFADVEIEP